MSRNAPAAVLVALAVLLVAPCAHAAPVVHESLAYTTPADHHAIAAIELEAAPPLVSSHGPLVDLDVDTQRARGAGSIPTRPRVATHDRSPPAR